MPQAEAPFAERVSIEEYLRSEEPVLAGFARALAEKGGGTIGVSPLRIVRYCWDWGPGQERGWSFRSETLYVVSVTDADIDEIAAQELSGLPYKGTRGTVQKDGSFVLRSGDATNGGQLQVNYFPDGRSSLHYESGCRPSDGSMGDLSQYTLPSTEEVFSGLVVYPAFDKDTKQPNPPPPARGDSGQSGQSAQSGGSGDESGEDQRVRAGHEVRSGGVGHSADFRPPCFCPLFTGSSCRASACAAALELLCFRLRRGAPVRGVLG